MSPDNPNHHKATHADFHKAFRSWLTDLAYEIHEENNWTDAEYVTVILDIKEGNFDWIKKTYVKTDQELKDLLKPSGRV